jgi:hypothetical protein
MSRHSIDLSPFDDGFRAEQPEERGDFESVPDGKYQVTVEKVEIAETQSTGNPMIKWTLRILAPKFRPSTARRPPSCWWATTTSCRLSAQATSCGTS